MKSTVSVKECLSYNKEVIYEKLKETLDQIGGIEKYVKKGDKVILKVNALMPTNANKSVSTHPEMVRAIIKEVKRVGGIPFVADNPASTDLKFTLKRLGIYKVMQEENVELIDVVKTTSIHYKDGIIYKDFNVSKNIIDADVLINLPKLKTHALTYMTVSIKNLFGLIPGLTKAQWHVKTKDPSTFSKMMVDLYGAILYAFKDKTILHVCDGIMGLEGDGPGTSGIPRQTNVILASSDGVALDRVACEVAGLNKDKIILVNEANRRNLGNGNINNINILGDNLTKWKDIKYIEPKDVMTNSFALRIIQNKTMRNILLETPDIEFEKCIKCGQCAVICPTDAMDMEKGFYPQLTKKECIRCWCCAETCPEGIIDKSKKPLLGKIIFGSKI